MPAPIEDLCNQLASSRHKILIIVGAGVACATDPSPCTSWRGLLSNGVDRCKERCHTLPTQWALTTTALIDENNTRSLIDAAGRIANALKSVHPGEYFNWLSDTVGSLHLANRETLDAILAWNTRIATTNYDGLLELASGKRPIVWSDGAHPLCVLRGDSHDILHLHGHYNKPESVVLDARTYDEVCRDEIVQHNLRSMLTRDTLVFIGCGDGLEDPNFASLFAWARNALGQCVHNHFRLVRQSDVRKAAEMHAGLPIQTISYGANHNDLPAFLREIFTRSESLRGLTSHSRILDERQDDYDTQRRQLDANIELNPPEYVRRSFELARSLWAAGGRRTAALHMHTVLSKENSPPLSRNEAAYFLEAADYLLQDGLDQHAMSLLTRVEPLLCGTSNEHATRDSHRRLLTRCLAAQADFERLQHVLSDALMSARGPERERIKAELAESHMLSGDLDNADRVLMENIGIQ